MSASPDISLSSSDESEGDEDGDILSSSGEITTDSETVDDPSNERPTASHSTSQSTHNPDPTGMEKYYSHPLKYQLRIPVPPGSLEELRRMKMEN